ncbi:SpoIID/LytB domain-containing protein [Proteinivorax hydrogeniformans]|uniref:SpoIID/LytB domain-containing protein n=1 Tax=Proteinivorax hydrogeniformans TaxID=1826727 RepID=A0AAU8HTA0_9FIRM
MKRTLKSIFIAVTVFILVFAMVGCRILQRPEEADPVPESDSPEEQAVLPEVLDAEEGQEPSLEVYLHEENRVETMQMEEYIEGVVAAEMRPNWDEEALAAQAIIARTFTLQKIEAEGGVQERNAHASTDIQEFQAYNRDAVNEQVQAAVERTRGEVAVYGGQFIRAWFHAYCGGTTATAKEGLNYADEEPPYIHRVDCPCYEEIDEEEREFEVSFSTSQVRNAVQEITGEDPGQFQSVEIAEESEGRAITLNVGDVEVNASELRINLGSTELRATVIEDITVAGNEVTFTGRGYGHGVGMCQWGAFIFARDDEKNEGEVEDKNAEEIVDYYFKDVSIQKLWD